MALNNTQNDQVRRFEKVEIFLSDPKNITVYSAFTPFNDDVTDFKAGYLKLKALIPSKDLTAALATTTDKNTLRTNLASGMGKITPLVRHYAKKASDTTLYNLHHASESDLKFQFAEADIYPYVTNALNPVTALITAKDAAFAKYNITQPAVDKVLSDAKAFDAMIGKPDVTSLSSSAANQHINEQISTLGNIISDMEDLVTFFKTSNPDFYEGFMDVKKLEHVGVRHNGVAGLVSQGGKPVSGAKILIDGSNKTTLSDATGHYAIIKIKAGTHQAICTLPDGTTTKTLPLKIQHGTTVDLDFDF